MCNQPCKECPYTTNSLPGYFGGNDPLEYAAASHRDVVAPCHVRSKYDENGMVKENFSPCVGLALAQMVNCKSPRNNPEMQKLHEKLRDEPRIGIMNTTQFLEHHELTLESLQNYFNKGLFL